MIGKYSLLGLLVLLLTACPSVTCPEGYEDIGIGQCVKKESK